MIGSVATDPVNTTNEKMPSVTEVGNDTFKASPVWFIISSSPKNRFMLAVLASINFYAVVKHGVWNPGAGDGENWMAILPWLTTTAETIRSDQLADATGERFTAD